jgi:hypothetical protein
LFNGGEKGIHVDMKYNPHGETVRAESFPFALMALP